MWVGVGVSVGGCVCVGGCVGGVCVCVGGVCVCEYVCGCGWV